MCILTETENFKQAQIIWSKCNETNRRIPELEQEFKEELDRHQSQLNETKAKERFLNERKEEMEREIRELRDRSFEEWKIAKNSERPLLPETLLVATQLNRDKNDAVKSALEHLRYNVANNEPVDDIRKTYQEWDKAVVEAKYSYEELKKEQEKWYAPLQVDKSEWDGIGGDY